MRVHHVLSAVALALATVSASAQMHFISNPCSILTKQEVSAIVAAPAKIGMKMDAAGMCLYNGSNGQTIFSVRGFVLDKVKDADEMFQSFARVVSPGALQTLSGIGDHAQIITTQQGDLNLYIEKKNLVVSLTVTHGPPPDSSQTAHQDALTQAGKQAAARL